jgi:hypothetical protein
MKSLSSYVSSVRQKAVALFHRADQLESDSAERRRAWDQVIAEHRKPLDPPRDSGKITPTQS